MTDVATFAAGCFWQVEEAFSRVTGVITTTVGYAGGHVEEPTYELVCSGETGHAEAVRVEFDPSDVTFEELLNVFWDTHNPTTGDRQGPDIGSQYRSAIYYHTQDQKVSAERSRAELGRSQRYYNQITTEITAATNFYPAEDYHQKYLERSHRA
ncbi:MAG TPA: peptide-methionine (S)-S-oxide reductase [Actinobacteria bacterium]|nr:peptide-methionine (S)-S-oxide reductase [Actinomycetota bacterium]